MVGPTTQLQSATAFDNATAETKTVNVWFKDAAGNVSGSVADAIELIEESGGAAERIAGNSYHTCAIKADDSVLCWGGNWDGQSTVPSGLGSVKSVASGNYHNCAVKADDSLECWGDNWGGQSTVPSGLGSVKSVAAGRNHTCSIKADDSVLCWGLNNYGETNVPSGLGTRVLLLVTTTLVRSKLMILCSARLWTKRDR